MQEQIAVGDLHIEKVLYDLVATDIAPGTGVTAADFWRNLEKILVDLMPRNRALLAKTARPGRI